MRFEFCSGGVVYIEPENQEERAAVEHFYCDNLEYLSDFRMEFSGPDRQDGDENMTYPFGQLRFSAEAE